MRGSTGPVPECWEPPTGGAIAEPLVPQLIAMFGLRTCWFEAFPFDVQLPRIEPGRIVLPAEEAGVLSWPLGIGVELPVRYAGLTLGRYVLVPVTPTAGVAFPPALRDEAIAMADAVGSRIAETLIAGAEPPAPNPAPTRPAHPDRAREVERESRNGAGRHFRGSTPRDREDLV
jgi:hypothetical protein